MICISVSVKILFMHEVVSGEQDCLLFYADIK